MQLLRMLNTFDCRCVSSSLVVARPGGSYEKFLKVDVPIKHLTAGRIKSSTLSTISAIPGLIRHIQKSRPDVVLAILDPAIAGMGVALRVFNRPRRPKFVACVQNNFTLESRDRKFGARCLQGFVERGYRDADLVLALSKGVAKDLCGAIPETQDKIKVIYNAVDHVSVSESSDSVNEIARPTDGPLLVSCGRFVEQKGFRFLIDSLAELNKRRRVYLWMLGTGPDLDKIKEQVYRRGLVDVVRFLGFQDYPYKFFKQADLFVLSSLWEGFGNVIVEAMSCGTPVVATRCPFGPSEIIDDGINGLLVDPGNEIALAQQIDYALNHPDLLRKLSAAALLRVQDFETTEIARQYEDAISFLVRGEDELRI